MSPFLRNATCISVAHVSTFMNFSPSNSTVGVRSVRLRANLLYLALSFSSTGGSVAMFSNNSLSFCGNFRPTGISTHIKVASKRFGIFSTLPDTALAD